MQQNEPAERTFGPYAVGSEERVLRFGGNPVALAPKVVATLVPFLESPGRVISKAELMERIWPGDFVDCKISVETRHDGLTVPAVAIQHGPKGDFVWVVSPDSIAEPRGVRVRQTLSETALIDRGLQVDETVVVEGQYYLRSGTRVEVVPQLQSDRSEIPTTE